MGASRWVLAVAPSLVQPLRTRPGLRAPRGAGGRGWLLTLLTKTLQEPADPPESYPPFEALPPDDSDAWMRQDAAALEAELQVVWRWRGSVGVHACVHEHLCGGWVGGWVCRSVCAKL